MFSVLAGCESTGQGWGKETDPKEETGLGDPSLQQKRTPEPGWSGWTGMHTGTTTTTEEVGASAEPGGWPRL